MISTSVYALTLVCAAAVDARLDVNVAKNRPSYQVSTHDDGYGIYYAAYANDGGHGTDLLSAPCMHTNSATNPWWAVDLGVQLYVHSVKFTNRDAWGTYAIFHVHLLTTREVAWCIILVASVCMSVCLSDDNFRKP